MGWTDLWFAHPGELIKPILKYWRNNPKFWLLEAPYYDFCSLHNGRCFVGVWSGPQNDLICLKHCETNREAETYLSPPGITIAHACLKALWKAWKLKMPPNNMEIGKCHQRMN